MFPRCDIPIKSPRESAFLNDKWDDVLNCYDNKDYKAVVYHILNYINNEAVKKAKLSPKKDIDFEIKHNSALLHIKVDDNGFSIKAPFIKITDDTNLVALLRKVSEINFSVLMLAQIIFEDDILYFNFSCSLEFCHAYKIFYIIREICIETEYFSNIFVEKYNAQYFISPRLQELSDDEMKTVLSHIKNIFEDYDKCIDYFERKRLGNYRWDIVIISLLKLANMPYINGTIRSEIYDTISFMHSDNELNVVIDKGMAFIKELKEKSDNEFLNNIYYTNIFYSSLKFINHEQIQIELEKSIETLDNYTKKGNDFAIVYLTQERLLNLIYIYNLDDKTKNKIYKTLSKIRHDTSFENASGKMLTLYNEIKNNDFNKNKKRFSLKKILIGIGIFYFCIKLLSILLGASK